MKTEVKVHAYQASSSSFRVDTEIHTGNELVGQVARISSVLVDLQEQAIQDVLAHFGYVKLNSSQKSCADGWAVVATKLSQIFTNWTDLAPTGYEAAARAIQKLADEGSPEQYQDYLALRRRCADLEQGNAKLKERVTDLERSRLKLDGRIRELLKDNADLGSRVSGLVHRMQQIKEAVSRG